MLNVKERSLREFLANAKQKRIDTALQRQSKARQELIKKNREQNRLSLKDTAEDAANEPSNLHPNSLG